MGPESKFEKQFREEIEFLGGICIKFKALERGMPDRVVLMPGGFTYWCEVKRPDGLGVISPAQKYQKDRFAELGQQIWLIDTYEAKQLFIEKISDEM